MPPRMGCRPYELRNFHTKVVAAGWNDGFAALAVTTHAVRSQRSAIRP